MRLDVSEDERDRRGVCALPSQSPVAVVRGRAPGFDPALWAGSRVGGPGMAHPKLRAAAVPPRRPRVADHLGQSIAPVPFVEHTVATRLLARFDALDADLVSGDSIATVAVRAAGPDGWRLAPAGAVADVVVGRVGDDLVVSRDPPPGVAPHNHAAMPIADRRRRRRPSARIGRRRGARSRTRTRNGNPHWCRSPAPVAAQEIAEYVKERHQFDRPTDRSRRAQQPADPPIVTRARSCWPQAAGRGPALLASSTTAFRDVTDFETPPDGVPFASDAAASPPTAP
jgi:hypothetical protein